MNDLPIGAFMMPLLFALMIMVVYGAGLFGIIYFAVRLAIRHERRDLSA